MAVRGPTRKICLLATGAHCPPHIGHIEALKRAADHFREQGYEVEISISPSQDGYVGPKMSSKKAKINGAEYTRPNFNIQQRFALEEALLRDEGLPLSALDKNEGNGRIAIPEGTQRAAKEYFEHWEVMADFSQRHRDATCVFVAGEDLAKQCLGAWRTGYHGPEANGMNFLLLGRTGGQGLDATTRDDLQRRINTHKSDIHQTIYSDQDPISAMSSTDIMSGKVEQLKEFGFHYISTLLDIINNENKIDPQYKKAFAGQVALALPYMNRLTPAQKEDIAKAILLLDPKLVKQLKNLVDPTIQKEAAASPLKKKDESAIQNAVSRLQSLAIEIETCVDVRSQGYPSRIPTKKEHDSFLKEYNLTRTKLGNIGRLPENINEFDKKAFQTWHPSVTKVASNIGLGASAAAAASPSPSSSTGSSPLSSTTGSPETSPREQATAWKAAALPETPRVQKLPTPEQLKLGPPPPAPQSDTVSLAAKAAAAAAGTQKAAPRGKLERTGPLNPEQLKMAGIQKQPGVKAQLSPDSAASPAASAAAAASVASPTAQSSALSQPTLSQTAQSSAVVATQPTNITALMRQPYIPPALQQLEIKSVATLQTTKYPNGTMAEIRAKAKAGQAKGVGGRDITWLLRTVGIDNPLLNDVIKAIPQEMIDQYPNIFDQTKGTANLRALLEPEKHLKGGEDLQKILFAIEDHLLTKLNDIPAPQVYSCQEIQNGLDQTKNTIKTDQSPVFHLVLGQDAAYLHDVPSGKDSIVMLASQFDYLEGQGAHLESNVTAYIDDPTQGPRVQIESAWTALTRRAAKHRGELPHGLTGLIPQSLLEKYPRVYENGYLQLHLIRDEEDKKILLKAIHENINQLKILPQWAICEASGALQLQVCCAAPSFQFKGAPPLGSIDDQICQELVVAQYVATAQLAVIRSRETGQSVPLHLTAVGQTSFKNRPEIMDIAMKRVAEIVQGENVQVFVHAFSVEPLVKLTDSLETSKVKYDVMTKTEFNTLPHPSAVSSSSFQTEIDKATMTGKKKVNEAIASDPKAVEKAKAARATGMPVAPAASPASAAASAPAPAPKRRGLFGLFHATEHPDTKAASAGASAATPTIADDQKITIYSARMNAREEAKNQHRLAIKFPTQEARDAFMKSFTEEAAKHDVNLTSAEKPFFTTIIGNPNVVYIEPMGEGSHAGVTISSDGKLSVNFGNNALRDKFCQDLNIESKHGKRTNIMLHFDSSLLPPKADGKNRIETAMPKVAEEAHKRKRIGEQ